MNRGNPVNAAARDMIANQMPRDGIFRRLKLLLGLEGDLILPRIHPTGQRYLQKKFLSNQQATSTVIPIMLRITNDLRARTELRVINGLNQTDIPEKESQPTGRANRIVRTRNKCRILFLLTKIHFLTEKFLS